ncbi:hypothetical protein M405DRAFT_805450, partial [Rhizopogon salebrosus TDB-379]
MLLATCTLLYPLATVHRCLPPSRATNVLTTTTLGRLAGFFQSFTSHSPARSQQSMLLTGIKYIPLFRSAVLVLNIYVH